MYMHVYVYAYSGGRLLPFMQEGVAFARATLGAHVLIIGSHTGANRDPHIGIHWGQQGSTLGPTGIHTGANRDPHRDPQ